MEQHQERKLLADLLREVISIRKLLILNLAAKGLSKSTIASALGITTAEKVRKLVPSFRLQSGGKNDVRESTK